MHPLLPLFKAPLLSLGERCLKAGFIVALLRELQPVLKSLLGLSILPVLKWLLIGIDSLSGLFCSERPRKMKFIVSSMYLPWYCAGFSNSFLESSDVKLVFRLVSEIEKYARVHRMSCLSILILNIVLSWNR